MVSLYPQYAVSLKIYLKPTARLARLSSAHQRRGGAAHLSITAQVLNRPPQVLALSADVNETSLKLFHILQKQTSKCLHGAS